MHNVLTAFVNNFVADLRINNNMNIQTLKIGDSFSRKTMVYEESINGFAKYSGDYNPVHIDEQYASETIFKHRIAHGFLIGSFISAVLGNEFPGNGTIYLSQTMKFRAPVYIGDEISIEVEIIDFPKENRVLLSTICKNQNDIIVIEGEALIIPPEKFKLCR
jgi:3-hydroxybutyryl-CoA dehydratase